MSASKGTNHGSGAELPPPLELECLSALWRLRAANVKQVRAALEPRRVLAYTTVMTLLERLARKGYLIREKQGRSFQYRPVVSREAVQLAAVRQLVDRLFDGSPEQFRYFLLGAMDSSSGEGTPVSASPNASPMDAALL